MNPPTLFPILPSEKPPKKPWLLWCGIVIVLLTIGFFAGRGFQHLKTGFHFEVREEKSYPFGAGQIRWRYVTEHVGLPFMDTGKTLIEYCEPGKPETTLYKSEAGFQGDGPFAANITTDGNTLRWDDGEFRYKLEMESMPPKKASSTSEVRTSEPTP